jgi:sulfonate transport system permease protein
MKAASSLARPWVFPAGAARCLRVVCARAAARAAMRLPRRPRRPRPSPALARWLAVAGHRLHARQPRHWPWLIGAASCWALRWACLGLSRRAAHGLPQHRGAAARAFGRVDSAGDAGLRLRRAHGIAVIAFASFWPMLVLVQAAVRQVEPRLLEVAHALAAVAARALHFKIVLPAMVPRLFVALRLGVAVALVVAVTVEIAANPQRHGLRDDDCAAEPRPRADAGLAVLDRRGGLRGQRRLVLLQRTVARRMGVQP